MSKLLSIQQVFELLACIDSGSSTYNQQLIKLIADEEDFDMIFSCLFHQNSLVVERAADAVEKISMLHPSYLVKHKTAILTLCEKHEDKEIASHLALIVSRIPFLHTEIVYVFDLFRDWVLNPLGNKTVRVNALQTLYELVKQEPKLKSEFLRIVGKVEKESFPSLTARIKKIRKFGL